MPSRQCSRIVISCHGNNLRAILGLATQVASFLRSHVLAALLLSSVLLGGLAHAAGQAQPVEQSGVAAQNSASQTTSPGLVHIVPFGANGSLIKNTAAPAGAHLTYWGGTVISQVHVVAVFWGTHVNTAITTPGAIDQFFTDITNSRFYDLLTEYSTAGVTGAGVPPTSSNQLINRGVFDGSFTITPSVCNITPPATCTIDDSAIQTELTNQIAAGNLPQPVSDAQGSIESFYMIYFPPGATITTGGFTSCVSGGFCAYHSDTATALVPYGVEPDFAAPSGCSVGCGAGTLFQKVTAVTSHELSEAVTDALVGSAATFAPPLAWYDPDPATGGTGALGEIADICGNQNVFVTAGLNSYLVQEEFSNLQNDCVSAPPAFNLTPPASVAAGVSFNLTLAIQSSVNASTLTGYLGTVHFTSSDATAVLPADYTFTSTDAGTHTFPITLKSVGSQTITVTDIHSAGFNGSVSMTVGAGPDLTIAKSHLGSFNQGQSGVSYSIIVSNAGGSDTSGTVTVNDTLPTGLIFAGTSTISGKGWTCDATLAPALSCTRSDALPAGTAYPVITLTVDVAANAPAQVTNTATVSGGSETNTVNDSSSDPTTITAPDLTISKQHTGNFVVGQTGATYSINVSNSGSGASLGAVTVSDTLPAGLSATSIAGAGWTCSLLPALSCTRSDPLAAAAAYPAITLTVDVTATAATTVTNSASVSGGNDSNTTNNTAQDPTIIDPPPAPDLTISKTHSAAAFVQGQSGNYSITVGNNGPGASSGLVTVSDTLPAGMTAAAIGGTGWTCSAITAAPLTCTRSDALASGSFYPAISLTVNVAANAPASLTNTATVSGGGDSNTANNSASDLTQIVPPVVDLQTSLQSSSGTFDQGQTNASYVVLVSNQGNVASSGAVTVTNSLGAGLTATAIGGTGWTCTLATLTCTRSDALAAGTVFPSITVTFNVANTAPASASATVAASGGGDSSPANNTATFSANINPAIAISLVGPGSSTVTAGAPATFNLSLTLGPAAGTVTFACSGLPTGAACSFNPASMTASGSESVTISTTSRAATLPGNYRFPGGNVSPFTIVLLALVTLAVLGLSDRRFRRRIAFATAGFVVLYAIGGCGGGGTQTGGPGPTPTPNPNGTPAGTYAITLTATGASSQASQPLTLVVK